MKLNRNIQVLRGVAVIGVVLFHAFPSIFKHGYFGVDIFFIISGFAIAPLLEKISQGTLTIKHFIKRRFWRLAPALILTIIVFLPLITLLGPISALSNTYKQSFFTLLLSGNISAYHYLGDYFRPGQNPFLHLWSLSTEQQIYLFVPVAIVLTMRFLKKINLPTFYIASGVLSLLLSYQINSYSQTINFYSPIYRYSQFCFGALIYHLSKQNYKNRGLNLDVNPIILISIIFILFVSGQDNFIYITLIILLFNKRLFVIQFDKNKILDFLELTGNRSYSLYLVHWPILWLVKHSPALDIVGIKQENSIMILNGLMLTWISGSFLYKKIENKFRYQNKFSYTVSIPFFLALILISTGLLFSNKHFFLNQTVLSRPVNQMDNGYTKCPIMTSINVCAFTTGKSKKILIIGDSHAGSISSTIAQSASKYWSVDSFLMPGCQYVDSKYLNQLRYDKNSQTCYRYSKMIEKIIEQSNYDLIIAQYRSSTLNPIEKLDWSSYSKIKIESLYKLVNTNKLDLLFIGPTPEFPRIPHYFDNRRLLLQGNENPTRIVSKRDMNTIPFLENRYYKKFVLDASENIQYLDVIPIFCNSKACSRYDKGWLFSDTDHLSALGAEKLTTQLKAFFMNIA